MNPLSKIFWIRGNYDSLINGRALNRMLSAQHRSNCVSEISRQFHHYFGCTISDYVRRVRIGRAQSLLSRGDQSVAEVALACGFCDQSHFTTAFGRLVGMSPRQWLIAKK